MILWTWAAVNKVEKGFLSICTRISQAGVSRDIVPAALLSACFGVSPVRSNVCLSHASLHLLHARQPQSSLFLTSSEWVCFSFFVLFLWVCLIFLRLLTLVAQVWSVLIGWSLLTVSGCITSRIHVLECVCQSGFCFDCCLKLIIESSFIAFLVNKSHLQGQSADSSLQLSALRMTLFYWTTRVARFRFIGTKVWTCCPLMRFVEPKECCKVCFCMLN